MADLSTYDKLDCPNCGHEAVKPVSVSECHTVTYQCPPKGCGTKFWIDADGDVMLPENIQMQTGMVYV